MRAEAAQSEPTLLGRGGYSDVQYSFAWASVESQLVGVGWQVEPGGMGAVALDGEAEAVAHGLPELVPFGVHGFDLIP